MYETCIHVQPLYSNYRVYLESNICVMYIIMYVHVHVHAHLYNARGLTVLHVHVENVCVYSRTSQKRASEKQSTSL